MTTTFRKICILRNFAFCNFYQNLGFQSLEEGWATLQLLLASRSIITMTQLLRKPSVRNIIRKTCILWNFAFYKFSENLGFQPLQKDWTTSQQLIIPWYHYHDTAFHKACSHGSWVRDIFRKTCNLRNFTFYKFSEDLGNFPNCLIFLFFD